MVGENESSMMIVSIWASITTRFTPPFLFCVTNLIIAILFIASKSNSKITTTTYNEQEHQHEDEHEHEHEHGHEHEHEHVRSVLLKPIVARVTLLLEGAKAVDLSAIIPNISTKSSQSSELPKYTSLSRLAQSIFFACSYDTQPDSKRYPSKKLPKPSPSLLGRLKPIDFSSIHDDDKTISTDSQHITNSPGQLVRARVNSTKKRTPIKPETPSTTLLLENNLDPDHRVIRHNSEKTTKKKTMVEIIKKSRSEIRNVWDDKEEVNRPQTARALRNATDDAKADDFITKFRGKLKLQRLDSLNRYNDMLRRPS